MCCIGTRAFDKRTLRADVTRHIVRAMQETGARRLICQTSLGYGDTTVMMPWYMTYVLIPILLKNAFRDHALQEEAIVASDLDWAAGLYHSDGKTRLDIHFTGQLQGLLGALTKPIMRRRLRNIIRQAATDFKTYVETGRPSAAIAKELSNRGKATVSV